MHIQRHTHTSTHVQSAHKGALPESTWNSGKGWEKAVHMPSCVTYVTEENLVFVKWALTYLTVDVVRWKGKGPSVKG